MPAVAISCIILFVPWLLVRAWIAPLPNTVQEQVEDAIEYGLDGIIVYVDQADSMPAFYSAGWKNRENKVPADPNSLFKIASISKLYIAVAVAKLVNDKRLSLDETLASYLPELAGRIENADYITLRMLVQHRSGIPNYADHPDYPWANPYNSNSEVYRLVLDMPADFKPDEKYSYSNTNYLLIGEILDKTLGYSHHQYVKQKILTPFGLNNTYSLLKEVDSDDVMSGYFVGYDEDIKLNDYIHPGGSMVASAQDVGIFLRALNDGSLLSDDEQAIYSSIYQYGYTGLLPGYQSIARYCKDIDAVVVQFVNTSGGDTWSLSEIIYNRIVKILRRSKNL
ncbi:Beta-lactamase [Mariniphaga anaerophila]|uniref:Beta-lactamase n=2 Tax=Mariniphaga anaerophila TaxID=1484053 RepID=A0A1M5E898_9BACT|nr:Beta-lactamase [Mariniphaga anaerophila]